LNTSDKPGQITQLHVSSDNPRHYLSTFPLDYPTHAAYATGTLLTARQAQPAPAPTNLSAPWHKVHPTPTSLADPDPRSDKPYRRLPPPGRN